MGKKYKMSRIKNAECLNMLIPKGCYEVRYANDEHGRYTGTDLATSHRNLSQLGNCRGTAYERSMFFGDTQLVNGWVMPKMIIDNYSRIYQNRRFSNKLFRFVRS